MTSTVACPDCHRPAAVLGRFTLGGADGPREYLRIRCSGVLSLIVDATEILLDAGVDPGSPRSTQ